MSIYYKNQKTDPASKADEIRSQMQILRVEIQKQGGLVKEDIQGIRKQVHDALDLPTQIVRHPWFGAGLGLIIGYLAIPKKKNKSHKEAELLRREVAELRAKGSSERESVTSETDAEASHSWFSQLTKIIRTLVVRFAINQGQKYLLAYLMGYINRSVTKTSNSPYESQKEPKPINPVMP